MIQSLFNSLESRVLLHAGSIDVAFNGGSLLVGDDTATIVDVAVLPDGGMIAAGAVPQTDTTTSQLYLAKYHFDGSLDTSFGNAGKIIATPRGLQRTDRIAMFADGSFIVGGSHQDNGKFSWEMVKFTPAGKVDTSFASNGVLRVPDLDYIHVFTIDAGQHILIGSSQTTIGKNREGVLRRYTSNGKLDTSFHGAQDVIITAEPQADDDPGDVRELVIQSVWVDPQGRILVGIENSHFNSGAEQLKSDSAAVYRLTPSGRVDRTYSSSGHVGTDVAAREIVPFVRGQIISSANGRLMKLNTDGSIDTDYGTNGVVDRPNSGANSPRIAVTPEGSVYDVVRANDPNDANDKAHFAVEKLDPTGQLDTSFGNGGTIDLAPIGTVLSIALAPDGSLVMAGQVADDPPQLNVKPALVRVYGGDGPAVQLVPRTLRNSARYLSMSVLIRDDDGVDLSTLDDSDLKLFDSAGSTRKIRLLSSEDLNGDGKYIRATYRIIGPGSTAWTSAANGTYEVRLQRRQITDTGANTAAAQVLGTVRMKIG